MSTHISTPDQGFDQSGQMADVRVWDPLVRFFHWTLVTSFLVAWVSAEDWDRLHVWAGYTIVGLISMRIIWGLIGTRYARFSNFIYRPAAVMGYLKDVRTFRAKRYLGHNPAGGAMVIVLLVLLALLSATGYLLTADAYRDAAWMGEWLGEFHEVIASVTLAFVGLHVLGVIFTSLQHGENLVRAMWTGRKRAE